MSLHTANIQWQSSQPFSHLDYNKDHVAKVAGQELNMSSANAEGFIDPEQALAASLASCHMLTFLALCAKKRLVVSSYEDQAIAEVKQNQQGKYYVDNIQLTPKAVFDGQAPDRDTLERMHQKAHEHCFISNSLSSHVQINL